MDRVKLEKYLADGITQREIARLVGRSQTNVRYWLVRHGLVPPPKAKALCEHCKSPIKNRGKRFCSTTCTGAAAFAESVRRFERGESLGAHTMRRVARVVFGERCAICQLEEWQEDSIPLVLDHIDGNSDNDTKGNLRLICPNCDARLPTFKGRNRGQGRHSRRERYKKGKSY